MHVCIYMNMFRCMHFICEQVPFVCVIHVFIYLCAWVCLYVYVFV